MKGKGNHLRYFPKHSHSVRPCAQPFALPSWAGFCALVITTTPSPAALKVVMWSRPSSGSDLDKVHRTEDLRLDSAFRTRMAWGLTLARPDALRRLPAALPLSPLGGAYPRLVRLRFPSWRGRGILPASTLCPSRRGLSPRSGSRRVSRPCVILAYPCGATNYSATRFALVASVWFSRCRGWGSDPPPATLSIARGVTPSQPRLGAIIGVYGGFTPRFPPFSSRFLPQALFFAFFALRRSAPLSCGFRPS